MFMHDTILSHTGTPGFRLGRAWWQWVAATSPGPVSWPAASFVGGGVNHEINPCPKSLSSIEQLVLKPLKGLHAQHLLRMRSRSSVHGPFRSYDPLSDHLYHRLGFKKRCLQGPPAWHPAPQDPEDMIHVSLHSIKESLETQSIMEECNLHLASTSLAACVSSPQAAGHKEG